MPVGSPRLAQVEITADAAEQIDGLPIRVHGRVERVLKRLANWPSTSGAKPLRGELKGNFRIRTGDYRIIFRYTASTDTVTVWRIGNRSDIYE